MKSPTTESHLTTPLRRPRGRRLRRGGCLLRVLLVLVVLGGGGALTLKLFGNDILPPMVDMVRGVVGPEAMAEVIAEVRRCAGTHFDPLVAEVFIRVAERDGATLVVNSAREVLRKHVDSPDPFTLGTQIFTPQPAPA